MKKVMLITLPIIGLIAIGIFSISARETCSAGTDCATNAATTGIKQQKDELNIEAIKRSIASGALLIDVRTNDEYAAEHASGSINLPVEQISAGEYPEVDKSTTIYVYCRSGKRANTALEAMKKAGYINVISITSLDNWKSLGGETLKS